MIIDWSRRRRPPRPELAAPVRDGALPYLTAEDGSTIYRHRPSTVLADHSYCGAGSGQGKTTSEADYWARRMVHEWNTVPPDQQMALFAVDMKSDFVELLLGALCSLATPAQLLAHVGFINVYARNGQPGAVPLNFARSDLANQPPAVVALQLTAVLSSASAGLGGGQRVNMGNRQSETASQLFRAVLEGPPEANLLWALDALQMDDLKQLATVTRSPSVRDYLNSVELSTELVSSISSRLRAAFALYDELENAVGASTCLPWQDTVRPGAVTLLDLGHAPLPSLAECMGNIIVRLVGELLLQRPSPTTEHHVKIACDEAQVLAESLEDVATRITTVGRSKNVSIAVFTQSTALFQQRAPELTASLLTNADTRTIGKLSVGDAEVWVRAAAPAPGVEESVGALRSRLLGIVTNLQPREFLYLTPGKVQRARSLPVDIAAWDGAKARQAEVVDAIRRRWSPAEPFPPRLRLQDYLSANGVGRGGARPRSGEPRRGRWG